MKLKREDIYCVYEYEASTDPPYLNSDTASLSEVCAHNRNSAQDRWIPLFFGTYDECRAWEGERLHGLATKGHLLLIRA